MSTRVNTVKITTSSGVLLLQRLENKIYINGIQFLLLETLNAEELEVYYNNQQLGHTYASLKASLYFFTNRFAALRGDACLLALADAIIIQFYLGQLTLSSFTVNRNRCIGSNNKSVRLPRTGEATLQTDFNALVAKLQ